MKRCGYIDHSKLLAPSDYLVCIQDIQILRKYFRVACTSNKRTPGTEIGTSCNNNSKTNSLMGKDINAEDKVKPAA